MTRGSRSWTRCAISTDRRGELFVSWNARGVTETEHGDLDFSSKLEEVRGFLADADKRGERVSALALQETWLMDDDVICVDGYRWIGRNRTKVIEDAGRPSGGVGWFVCEKFLDHAKCKVETPKPEDCGGCEGLIILTISKENKIITLINAYTEQDRDKFKVNKSQFTSKVMDEFRRRRQNDETPPGVQRYTYVMWDANVRCGTLQEPNSSWRDGESTTTPRLGKHLVKEIGAAGGLIVHGRSCPWNFTYQPDDARNHRSVIDYIVTDDLGGIFDAGTIPANRIRSDHNGHPVLGEEPREEVEKTRQRLPVRRSTPS